MVGISEVHAAALNELVEWWQDLARRRINSRAVLLPVPPGWGRTRLLNEFAAVVENDEVLSIVVRVPGAALPNGLGLQSLELQKLFSDAHVEHRVAELLGVDRLGGAVQLGLGVTGLFVSPLAALVGLLLASIGVDAAGKVWDNSPVGQEGTVAKLARAVAAVSVSVPVIVIIDDADQLQPDLAVVLVENLIGRIDGQVLVAAAVNPGADLMSALTSRAKHGLTEGRVRTVDTDPSMNYQARVNLTAELCPDLPNAAIRRIGQRTRTFAEAFAVASAERLTELAACSDDAARVTVIDEVVDARTNQAPPSELAIALAWAGGILQALQAEQAVKVLGEEQARNSEQDVIRFESLVRLADPASPRLAEQVRVLAARQRHGLAKAVLDAAVEISADPRAGLVDKVVAWQAVHRTRADLQVRSQLASMQCQLIHGLEDLGDLATAYEVAATALAEYRASAPGEQRTPEYADLSAAVIRLARTQASRCDDPLTNATIAAVAAGGAAIGLEARIWAAIDLVGQPGQRERALNLTDQITAELSQRNDLAAVGNRWRLLLAFHLGRAGHPAISQQLAAPMLDASGSPEDEDAARAVLRAVGGPGADTRLQIIGLQAELAALPPDADDELLRVNHALAADYGELGDYRHALHHGQLELSLRRHVQGADHFDTLTIRSDIVFWTGACGDPVEALRLARELLADQERVLGPHHPSTLGTRSNIASWTGDSGHPAEALRLFRELLPDQKRVLGPHHPNVFGTRNNIAFWTGESGRPAEALGLYREVLPDQELFLGLDHPDTLATRNNIASLTGECGDLAEALQLYREVLPGQERVLGPDHPDTLGTRNNIAFWTGECGHPAEALLLFQELLPDQERIFGPCHPHTLTTRNNVAFWTWRCEDPAEALRLFRKLLPDRERVLGPDHPDTLATRNNIAFQTGECGHPAEALRLFQELLPDHERVLGPDHPDTLRTRNNIAFWTGECGHPAEALRLYRKLLPDQERIFGSDHPETLFMRHNIERLKRPGMSS